MKPALVTGACGFSGGHMVKILADEGVPVRGTDLACAFESPKVRKCQEMIGVDWDTPGVEFVESDLGDPDSLRKVMEGVGVVYHTASLYDYSAPMAALEKVNIQGTVNLCEAMLDAGIERVVHWSTAGVYGHPNMPRCSLNPLRAIWEMLWGIGVRPWLSDKSYHRPPKHPTNQPFTEDGSTPINTPGDQPRGSWLVNDYSVTKWKQEQIIQRYGEERGLRWTIMRPAPLYGPGSDYGIGGIVIAISEGLVPILPLDLRNYLMVNCHVRDIGRAAHFLASREDTLFEDYNVSDPTVISQLEFLMIASLLVGRKVHLIPILRMPWLQPLGIWSARHMRRLEQRHERFQRIRIWEESSARYLSSSYWISSNKLRGLGFEWEYADFRLGLRDTVEWFIKAGWIQ
ncbi:MAG: NAD(P)-dependent oxidoreductase [Actinobacteria bacterium]|nr:NAD(P)-dependent oxidoreductase [Actinomycetota bacterium]MBU1944774.1 NAD(P)-dependent oxidoreductase [Actinomycetota bacterium]MBU2688865.1 NAD(P)-dependent oxidoreductase [Actinomycetota bacterium]